MTSHFAIYILYRANADVMPSLELAYARWRFHALVNGVNIGQGNGFAPING